MTTITDKLKENREKYLKRLETIRSDEDLTPEAKARRISPIFQEAKAAENRLRRQRVDALEERRRQAEREAFAPPALFGSDPATVQMNYRHALNSVAGITDGRELSEKLEMANLTGDRTLARAVAYRANALKLGGVVEEYLASDEDARKKWQSWADAHEEQEQARTLGGAIQASEGRIEEPPELSQAQGIAKVAVRTEG